MLVCIFVSVMSELRNGSFQFEKLNHQLILNVLRYFSDRKTLKKFVFVPIKKFLKILPKIINIPIRD